MTDAKLDGFMDELGNRSAQKTERGSFALYKVHKVVSWLMVFITVAGMIFIVENQIFTMELPTMAYQGKQFDVAYIGILLLVAMGGFWISKVLEDGKVESIAGFINSFGKQKMWFSVATVAIVILLITINTYGVKAGADFFSRYLNAKVLEDDKIVLTQKTNDRKMDMINSWRERISKLESDKDRLEAARASSLAKYPGMKWRAKTTAINKDYDAKLSALNKDIDRYNYKIDKKDAGMSALDSTIQDVIDVKRAENQLIIDAGKKIGFPVAMWGEIIDAIFAFLYFLIYKSDARVQGKTSGSRVAPIKKSTYHDRSSTNQKQKPFSKKIESLKAEKYSWKSPILDSDIQSVIEKIGVGADGKQPSQRKIVKMFKETQGQNLRPERLVEFNKRQVRNKVLEKRGKFYYYKESVS